MRKFRTMTDRERSTTMTTSTTPTYTMPYTTAQRRFWAPKGQQNYYQHAGNFSYTIEFEGVSGKRPATVKGLKANGELVTFSSVEAARKAILEHDYAKTEGRNPLSRVKPGVYEAVGGRIRVERKTSPQLRALLFSKGATTVKPGYAVFVDGKFYSAEFSVREAQHEIAKLALTDSGAIRYRRPADAAQAEAA